MYETRKIRDGERGIYFWFGMRNQYIFRLAYRGYRQRDEVKLGEEVGKGGRVIATEYCNNMQSI